MSQSVGRVHGELQRCIHLLLLCVDESLWWVCAKCDVIFILLFIPHRRLPLLIWSLGVNNDIVYSVYSLSNWHCTPAVGREAWGGGRGGGNEALQWTQWLRGENDNLKGWEEKKEVNVFMRWMLKRNTLYNTWLFIFYAHMWWELEWIVVCICLYDAALSGWWNCWRFLSLKFLPTWS